jgi:hypothetical protein
MDDSLIFFDEDEQSNQAQMNQSSVTTRSALWFVELGGKIFKSIDRSAQTALEQLLEDQPDLEEMDTCFVQVGRAFEPNPFGLEQLSKTYPLCQSRIN